MILVLDTETTGLVNHRAPEDHPCQPRLVQLAAVLQGDAGESIGEMSVIVQPHDFEIPKECARIHGISTERALECGVSLKTALALFVALARRASTIVAHNIAFDIPVLRAELKRVGWPDPLDPAGGIERYCTMVEGTDICKLPGRGRYKWPKLAELHQFLFNEALEGAHNALHDVRATARCYRELTRKPVGVAA